MNETPRAKTIQHLLICTGDASAAEHAATLIHTLKTLQPDLPISAVGNDVMAQAGATLISHHDDIGMGGWGLWSTFQGLWGHWKLAQKIKNVVKNEAVDRVLLVDYSGFHLKVAQILAPYTELRYYIPPQLWASRPYRMKAMQRFIQKVYTIFPFENQYYANAQIPFLFVGHPLVESLPPAIEKSSFCATHGLNPSQPLVGIFPGSRVGEVQRMLPVFAQTIAQINQTHPHVQWVLAQAPNLKDDFIKSAMEAAFKHAKQPVPLRIAHQNHAILSASDLILGASGTTSLEAALYQTPMVIAYKVDILSAWFARRVILIPYIGLPNLLVPLDEAPILPERLQKDCTAELLAEDVLTFLDQDSEPNQKAMQGLAHVRESLGEGAGLLAFATDLLTP
ncbi:MAG: lipid-A-disaccharide synthase [Vampirovibrio sp.]